MADLENRIRELRSVLQELIATVPDNVPYINFLVKGVQGTAFSFTPKRKETRLLNPLIGIAVRIHNGNYLQEFVKTDISAKEARKLFKEALGSINFSNDFSDFQRFKRSELTSDFATQPQIYPHQIPLSEKSETLENLMNMALNANHYVNNVRVNASEKEELSLFIDRDRNLFQKINVCATSVTPYVAHNGKTQTANLSQAGTIGWETAQLSKEKILETVETAVEFLDAKPIEPGMYDIIANPQTTGIIVHEAFGHGVEMDMFRCHRARASKYFQKRVGSSMVNIIDDSSKKGMGGSFFFDDEGELARETIILKDGIFNNGLTDMISAHALNVPRSPNGRRADITRKDYARMTNTFFKSGSQSVDDLISGIDKGVYLFAPWNGMEDPLGWGLQVDNHFAREIRGGKLKGKLYSPIVMTGYVPDILMSVSAVANDFDTMNSGMCGKGHKEYVRVGLGGPHIRLRARLG